MSESHTIVRPIGFAGGVAMPLCLLVSACGGDGTSMVASIPPPPPTPSPTPTPTPTPTATAAVDVKTSWLESPATHSGTYDVIGSLTLIPGNGGLPTSNLVSAGEFTMSTDWGYFGRDSGDLPSYRLNAAAGAFPGGIGSISVVGPFLSWGFDPLRSFADEPRGSYCCQMLGQHLTAYGEAADGSKTQILSSDLTRAATMEQQSGTTNSLQVTLDYDIGYSYVAMGEWSWRAVDVNGSVTPYRDSGRLLFVSGDRTPAAGIPVSGTATYDARSLSGWVKLPFALTADFGQRTISARIDQDYSYNPAGDIMDNPAAFGVHVGGNAPFTNSGSFDIPLAGTVNWASSYAINTPETPPTDAATGNINGAFFGPHAEQVGGMLSLLRTSGQVPLLQDAFVGQQHHP